MNDSMVLIVVLKQSSFLASQHRLASFRRKANIKIPQDIGTLMDTIH